MNQFRNLSSAKVLLCNAPLLALVSIANAHPGHSALDHGAAHVVTSPYHLLILVTMGVGAVAAEKVVRRRWVRQCMRIAGIGAVAAAGVLCTLGY